MTWSPLRNRLLRQWTPLLLASVLLLASPLRAAQGGSGPKAILQASVRSFQPGEPVHLTLHVEQDGETLTDYDVVHDKLCHLMLVSADYTDFQHIHPTLDSTGKFRIRDVVFRRPGRYYVFLDVTPQGSGQLVQRFEVQVQGQGQPLKLQEDLRDRGAAGVRIRLVSQPKVVRAGDALLRFQLTRGGQPVRDLKPLMSALGHVVALGKEGKPFLHIHPFDPNDPAHAAKTASTTDPDDEMCIPQAKDIVVKPGEVVFHARFPRAGLYQVWGQFLVGEQQIIAPFTLQVQ